MTFERWLGVENGAGFDWQRAARALDVPLAAAQALYVCAMESTRDPAAAESLYRRWLRDAATRAVPSATAVPGRRTRLSPDRDDPAAAADAERDAGPGKWTLLSLAERRTPPPAATVLRRPAPPTHAVDAEHPAVAAAIAGASSGQPLPEVVRARMAALFGHPLARVRVHHDAVAHDAARALGATAFTAGDDVFFAAGAPAPDAPGGEQLLAHELAHVIQGYQGRVPAAGGGVRVVDPGDVLEREAEAVAADATDAQRPPPSPATAVAAAATGPTRVVLRSPAPPAGQTRDTSHLRVTGTATSIDYYDFMVRHDSAARSYSYTGTTTNMSATWILYDRADVEVYRNEFRLVPQDFRLVPSTVRRHVEHNGPARLGDWTLRLIKDAYYDDLTIHVGEGTGPGSALDGHTTAGLFNIRQLPSSSATVLATLPGSEVPVTVTDKVRADEHVWYHITLGAAIGAMAAGASGWVIDAGVVATASWSMFRSQLHAWETAPAQATLTLSDRITRLRQMCHNRDLPFDSVIGVAAGSQYLDTRGFVRSDWQLLQDAQIVRMPDGVQVDVYHLLVGLDVLPRRVEHQTYYTFDVGQNYSAATWSGDIGAGVADAAIGQDADWEHAMLPAGLSAPDRMSRRIDHYYASRAPEGDLIGDIDAWGIDAARSQAGAPTTIEGLLAAFYGTPAPAPGSAVRQVTPGRRTAIERFLRHYGFHTAVPLRTQTAPRDAMQLQIETFARMWIRNRQHVWSGSADVPAIARTMTDRFLDWLGQLAAANAASIPAPTPASAPSSAPASAPSSAPR